MSVSPRSQILIADRVTTGGSTGIFTAPANMIVLVKSALVYNGGSAAANVTLVAEMPSGNVVYVPISSALAAGTGIMWQGWFVLNPGYSVFVSSNQLPFNAWVSGAVLLGAPPVAPV